MSSKILWIVPAVLALGVTLLGTEPAGDIQVSPYAWAGACRECHADIYQAWFKTKHRTALKRLRGDDRQRSCLGCHVTGAEGVVLRETEELNAGVQCEACHGAAAGHASAATDVIPATEGLKKPGEKDCLGCHNERSPHFRGFTYKLLIGFVHPMKP